MLNGTIPEGATDPITVKFAQHPSSSKNILQVPSVAAASATANPTQYLAPAARRFLGPIHHPAARFR